MLSGWADGCIRAHGPEVRPLQRITHHPRVPCNHQSARLVWCIQDAHPEGVTALAPLSDALLSGGADGTLRLWQLGDRVNTLRTSIKVRRGLLAVRTAPWKQRWGETPTTRT